MRISRFTIKNFKGIEETSISLSDEVPGRIVPLIGLNESGKTTILEALSQFVTEEREVKSIFSPSHHYSSIQDIIPKHRKGAFTGSISIVALVIIEEEDKSRLFSHFQSDHDIKINISKIPDKLTVEAVFNFEDSVFTRQENLWSIRFYGKPNKQKLKRDVEYDASPEKKNIWLSGVSLLRSRIPKVAYYPTFLFNFPERIYLENNISDGHEYYVQLIQDIFDGLDETLLIKKHIVERVNKFKKPPYSPSNFFPQFYASDERKQIDSIVQTLSHEMSRVIFGAWSEIIGREIKDKRIQVDWSIDHDRENAVYLEIYIVDGKSKYALSERSMGFRWFFAFLLFTQFRKNRKDESSVIFLFDEPASNLHSRAQSKLLENFSNVVGDKNYILYSTHSHYLINPMWLDKAYIISNEGVDYDTFGGLSEFSPQKPNIKALRYRQFINKNPTKTTYFQPALDALQYLPSKLEGRSKALIVEGKFDYYPLIFFKESIGINDDFDVFPAMGAGSLGNLINLFRGWGRNFRILLDADRAGRDAKKRYMKEFLIMDSHISTVGEICKSAAGGSLEALFGDDVDAAVIEYLNGQSPTKRGYSLYFQSLISSGKRIKFPDTENMFGELFEWIENSFVE